MEFKTLTPLWTGGADKKVDRIHETGIIGSMRWWYEVLVRGVGGRVCSPDSDGEKNKRNKCDFNAEGYRKSQAGEERPRLREAGLCDVCRLFGATGWKRRFRLEVVDCTAPDRNSPKKITIDRKNPKTNKKPEWYLPDHPRSGRVELTIKSLAAGCSPEPVEGLLQFIADWGALGAKGQMGFGIVAPVNGRIDTRPLYNQLDSAAGNCRYPKLPSLQNMFFARIKKEGAKDNETFNLKHDLRQLFAGDRDLRHFIMGTANKHERMAAKIKISRPYDNGVFRLWGWIPEEAEVYKGNWNREEVLKVIHDHLTKNYEPQVWREMNSLRDTVMPDNGGPLQFLRSLLALEEG